MSNDEIKRRFVSEINQRGYEDKYVDRGEEREIIQIAIQLGVGIDSARSAIVQVCDESGYVLESAIVKQIQEQVETVARNGGLVGWKEFETIFANVQEAVQGKKNDREIKRMIIAVMEETGNTKIKKGWFTNWYATLKTEVGM